MTNDIWYEDGAKTILISFLTSGAISFFENEVVNKWSIMLMITGSIGLLALAYHGSKKTKNGNENE